MLSTLIRGGFLRRVGHEVGDTDVHRFVESAVETYSIEGAPTPNGTATLVTANCTSRPAKVPCSRHSVETELVAFDVLQRVARLVVLIGMLQQHGCRAERDQPCTFGLEHGQALLTHEPGADSHIEMQPIFDGLPFGNALEVQTRTHARGIDAREP